MFWLQRSVRIEDPGQDEAVVAADLGPVSTPSVYHDEDDPVIRSLYFEVGSDGVGNDVPLIDEQGSELAEPGPLEEVHVQLDPVFTPGANEAHPTS